MLQNQNRAYNPHLQQNQTYQHYHNTNNNASISTARQQQQHLAPTSTTSSFPDLSSTSLDLSSLDTDIHNYKSLSSSPISSTQSLSQFSSLGSSPLSTFDSIPTPRGTGGYEGSLFDYSPQSQPATLAQSTISLFPNTTDLMQTDTWNGQLTPRSVGRFSHHRESSLSSLGSNGPASPFSHNTTNPQIAVTDSPSDGFHGFTGHDDYNYQLTTAKPFPGVSHDTFYTSLPSAFGSTGSAGIPGYPQLASAPKRKNDRGFLQPAENPIGSNRSQPVSVASSINSDSPATPAGDLDEDRRNKNGNSNLFDMNFDELSSPSRNHTAMHTVPKLDRTMTDIYADELYNPNFTITSSTSSAQMPITSPTHDMFVQRIQAANNQHLTAAANSPVSATSRDRSPFRQGSPLAPMGLHDFGSSQVRFGSVQHMREQNKALQDAQAQQQFGRSVNATTPPATISPKDALLEFHETEGDSNYPLFPQQQNNNNFMGAMSKPPTTQSQPAFDGLPMDSSMFNNYLGQLPQLPVQVPQQYPFIAQPRHQNSVPSLSNGSLATTRVSSADVGSVDSSLAKSPQRPTNTSTDGGTYTCTYHGCTHRFETPALLQKHKREGHRQAHGLNGARRPDGLGVPANMMSQAGPHRCDRINPSTGKPCNTVFSRPYDLTRHEDTIHNARKQKVRCNLCTDEKTFSRADALTRHYRVCHPDVEFPGKRRRGAHAG